MKKSKNNDEIYDDEFLIDKRHIKESRSKEKYQARRQIDAYLDKKSLKELLDDYDFDWGDYNSNSDNNDFRI